MKDFVLPIGLVTKQDLSKDGTNGFFSLRKSQWRYLNKMNVAFYDPCCPTANIAATLPVSYITTGNGQLQYWNGTTNVAVPGTGTTPSVTSLTTTSIAAPTGSVLLVNSPTVERHTPTPANATATLTTTQVSSGYITSTSAAATTLTLPTAGALATALGASQGSIFDFFIDNKSGANIVTIAVGTGATPITPIITGEATLTVASGTVAQFRLIFTSPTAAFLARLI